VRIAFEQLFAGDGKLAFRLDQVVVMETVGLAVQSAIEHIYLTDGNPRGAAIATNVFMRTPSAGACAASRVAGTGATSGAAKRAIALADWLIAMDGATMRDSCPY